MKVILEKFDSRKFISYYQIMLKKIPIRELSNKTGVSPSTLSRVMNHPDLVKKETRQMVYTKLDEIGYSLNKNKRKRQNMIIGITVSNPKSVFASTLIGYISNLLSDTNYQLLVFDIKKRLYIRNYMV